jgi:hypothetical protein
MLDGNPWSWSNTSNKMQTPKFKIINASQANSIQKYKITRRKLLRLVILISDVFPLEDGRTKETRSG